MTPSSRSKSRIAVVTAPAKSIDQRCTEDLPCLVEAVFELFDDRLHGRLERAVVGLGNGGSKLPAGPLRPLHDLSPGLAEYERVDVRPSGALGHRRGDQAGVDREAGADAGTDVGESDRDPDTRSDQDPPGQECTGGLGREEPVAERHRRER